MLKNKLKFLLTICGIIILFLCVSLLLLTSKESKANIVIIADENVLVENDKSAGISNTKNLQALIDKVHNAGGGTVEIPEGTYYFTVDINDGNLD